MVESIDLSKTKLTNEERKYVNSFCNRLREILKENLQSLTLYGSAIGGDYRPGKSDINILIVLDRITLPILKTLLDPVSHNRRYGIAPFFITEINLRSSADVFPIKFLAIQKSHQILWGRDILKDIEINQEHLRLRCEQELKNLLLQMRRYYILGSGHKLIDMLSINAKGFLETLRVAVFLKQKKRPSNSEIIDAASKTFEIETDVLKKVSELRNIDKKYAGDEAETLYGDFMGIVEKIALEIDKMG